MVVITKSKEQSGNPDFEKVQINHEDCMNSLFWANNEIGVGMKLELLSHRKSGNLGKSLSCSKIIMA